MKDPMVLISLRISQKDKDRFQKKADKSSRSLSNYIRLILSKERG